MSKYLDVIYNREEENYPEILVDHLLRNYVGWDSPSGYVGKTLLDIGCGTEIESNLFRKYGLRVNGIDRDWGCYDETWRYRDLNIDKLPWEYVYFDFIFSKSTIEHIYNTEHLLSEAYRVLKPGGKAIFLTPAWEYNYKWFYDDPTHIKPFCRKGLQDALKIAGFKNVEVEYFYHLPYTWQYDIAKLIPKMIRLLPDNLRWKNEEETEHRVWIRFSKEVQLLAVAEKGG